MIFCDICNRGAQSAMRGEEFGSGDFTENQIVMDGVECDGSESGIELCDFTGASDCNIDNIAGVRCIPNEGTFYYNCTI